MTRLSTTDYVVLVHQVVAEEPHELSNFRGLKERRRYPYRRLRSHRFRRQLWALSCGRQLQPEGRPLSLLGSAVVRITGMALGESAR
jgi:hypothetical protein